MKISSREKKIFLYSLLFLAASFVLAILANIWFTFNESSRSFNIFVAGYSVGFLGFSGLVAIAAGKFLSRLNRNGILTALSFYVILAIPSNYMFWLLLGLLIKKLPKILLDLVTYTDGKQLAISALSTLIVLISSTIWFFLARKRRKNRKLNS
ncbi:MAG: hypothetical protein WAW11_02600 [Patescibacteria group bacterium]